MRGPISRRTALLGAAGLLGGCSLFDDIFGERRERFPGERQSVMSIPERTLEAASSAAGTAVTLPPQAPRTDWPVAGGDLPHSGGHIAFGPGLGRVWSSGFGSGNGYRRRLLAGPVAQNGTAYVSDSLGVVSAFDVATGSRRWRRETDRTDDDTGTMGSGAAVSGETLYVATGLAELLALNIADGSVRWRVDLPGPARGAPTVAGTTVYVPTVSSHLVALATDDGRRIWTHRANPIPTIPLGLGTPAVEGDTVIAGFPSGELLALRASDGRVLWSESLAATGGGVLSDIAGVRARPAVADGRVVAVGMGGLTICVDLRSGRRLWEQEAGGTEGAWMAGNWVFMTTDAGQVVAMERESGVVRWAISLRPPARGSRAPDPIVLSSPILAGGRLLIGTSLSELVSIDPSGGDVLSRQSLPAGLGLQPIAAGGLLLAATDDATLLAFSG
ncbi:outer membrane protein assembly factor BamB family protein [Neoroseomonas terrae]|nr:PQQ-like beta-propeller repeat protein [Neoroseomonas terrae]